MAKRSPVKKKSLSRLTKENKEQEIVSAIMGQIERCDKDTSAIRAKWRENYQQFVNGSVFTDKEDWQSNFSLNPFAADIRAAHGRLIKILIESADWYSIEPRSNINVRAQELAPAFRTLFSHYLDRAKFSRHASSFILSALVGMGVMSIGWKPQLVMNPKYVSEQAKRARQKEQQKLSKVVDNPEAASYSADSISRSVERVFAALPDLLATGEFPGEEPQEKLKPFVQVGGLDIQTPNNEFFYWDSNVSYMEESAWNAAKTWMNVYDVRRFGELGFFNENAKDISPNSSTMGGDYLKQKRYQGIRKLTSDKIEIVYYFGPLIINDCIEKEMIYAVIGNGSELLKYTEYPYWEPPSHRTAMIASSVRQIPHRASGAGIGDNAVAITRQYDANWQLISDQARLGVLGINILDRHKLVEPDAADEALEPGKHIQCRGNPKEVFHHIDLTSNIENQVLPIQEALRSGIQEQTGVNAQLSGRPQSRSRTTAEEIRSLRAGSSDNVDTIAIDIEQGFLVNALEKMFARVVQFGLDDLERNPELKAILPEDQFEALSRITEEERIEILNQFYSFKIKGFSGRQDKDEKLARYNEFLSVVASNPAMAGVVDPIKATQHWLRLAEMEESDILLTADNEYRRVVSENEVLASNHMVEPSPEDNHELHLKIHGPLAFGPAATEAARLHAQMHMQAQQEQQALMQMNQQLSPGMNSNMNGMQ